MRPTIFLFVLVRKERRCRARYQKEKIAKRGLHFPSLSFSPADILHFCHPVRRTTPLPHNRPRKASLTLAPLAGHLTGEPRPGCVVQRSSEVSCSGRAECGTPKPRPTAIAATLVLTLDSPPLREIQRSLPLVAFLWNPKTVSFRNRKEMVFALRRLRFLSAK